MLSLISSSSLLSRALRRNPSLVSSPTPRRTTIRRPFATSRFAQLSSPDSHLQRGSDYSKHSRTSIPSREPEDFKKHTYSRRRSAHQDLGSNESITGAFEANFADSRDFGSGIGYGKAWKLEPIWRTNPVHLRKLSDLAAQLPRVDERIIQGNSPHYRPSKLSPSRLILLGEAVKILDTIVTRNAHMTVPSSLDLLHVVQAFPDQLSQWASLHMVDPRSRSAQLWALGVLHALARLQHPLTVDLWLVAKDSEVEIPITLFVELCHYFGQSPPKTSGRRSKASSTSSDTSPASPSSSSNRQSSLTQAGTYKELTGAERAIQLQNVLKRAKQTGNTVVILACWNYTIQGLLKQGDIAGADRELIALHRMGFTPTLETLQSFILYYSKHISKDPSYVEKVAAYHSRIKKLNMSPDLHTYSEIIRCYERSFRYKQMDAVLLEMTHSQLQSEASSSIDAQDPTLGSTAPHTIVTSRKSSPNSLHSSPSTLNAFVRKPQTISGEIASNLASASTVQVRGPRAIQTGHISEELEPITPSTIAPSSMTRPTIIQAAKPSSTDFADVEERKRLLLQKSGSAVQVQLGSIAYSGGAQWLGGGRKQPNRVRVQQQVDYILDALSATSPSIPTSSTSSPSPKEPSKVSREQSKSSKESARPSPLDSQPSMDLDQWDDFSSETSPSSTSMGLSFKETDDILSTTTSSITGLRKRAQEAHVKSVQRAKVVEAWSRAIYSALNLGSMRKAMVLVEEMESLGLEVNDRICTEFMYFAGKHGRPELLHRWWQKLNDVLVPLNQMLRKHYLIYMRELLRLNLPVEARKVMAKICQDFGHSDDTYALWIRYYSSRDLVSSLETTLRQMEAHNVEYGLYSISALLQLFARRGDVSRMFEWFEKLKSMSSNAHAMDDVMSRCAYQFLSRGHLIEDVKSWTDALPPPSFSQRSYTSQSQATPQLVSPYGFQPSPNSPPVTPVPVSSPTVKPHFPRLMGALMTTLGHQKNESGLDYIVSLCSEWRSTYTLVGLITGSSYLPSSPSRDRMVVEYIESCSSLKHMLNSAQNDDVFQALSHLEMPALILEWANEIATLPVHVVEPSQVLFHHIFKASIQIGNPEAFVTFANKAYDKFGVSPKLRTIASSLRAIIHSRNISQIAHLATSLVELCPRELVDILTVLDEELTQVGIARPQSLTAPAQLSNPSTLDIASYISRRLGPTKS